MPADWRRRTHPKHQAFGGIRSVLGAWRVPHQTPMAGLWFVGAQSESDGGVNNVMPAAFKIAVRAAEVGGQTPGARNGDRDWLRLFCREL